MTERYDGISEALALFKAKLYRDYWRRRCGNGKAYRR